MAPRLDRGSLVVQAENPASLINVILYGPQTHAGVAPSRWLKPMAAYQYELDNEEIAVVASYIRQSWHNLAPEVTAEDVARQR